MRNHNSKLVARCGFPGAWTLDITSLHFHPRRPIKRARFLAVHLIAGTRPAVDAPAQEALSAALNRVISISRAHRKVEQSFQYGDVLRGPLQNAFEQVNGFLRQSVTGK